MDNNIIHIYQIMKKKNLILSIMTAFCLLLLVGCAPKTKSAAKSDSNKAITIKLGAMPAPDSAPLYVAQRKVYFKDEGINVKLTLFKDSLKRDAAVSSNQLDGTVTDLAMYPSYIKGNTGWKLGTALTGKFGVVSADKSIDNFASLKGKSVGLVPRSIINYYLSNNLKKDNLTLNDINSQKVADIPTRLQMISEHKIDATVVPEPFLTMAKAKGLNVFGVSDPKTFSGTALAFNKQISNDPALQKKFYKAYNRAVKDLNNGDDKTFRTVLSKDLSLPEKVANNIAMPKYENARTVNLDTFKDVLKFCKENGSFTKNINPKDYILNVNK